MTVAEQAPAEGPAEGGTPKRAEQVAEQIRTSIARGHLVAGDALPSESVLLQRHGVARPTMREALRILESEGLLTVKRGKGGGPRVALPRVDAVAKQAGFLLQVQGSPVIDVLRARRVIETPVIEHIEALTTPVVLEALKANIEAARRLQDDPDAVVSQGTALHDEFHRIVVRAAVGDTLSLFHAIIESIVDRTSRSFVSDQGRNRRGLRAYRHTLDAHEQILASLRERDRDRAAALWAEHLGTVERAMVRGAGDRQRVVDLFGPTQS